MSYIPIFDTTFVPYVDANPVSSVVQLCYVLPKSSLSLMPTALYVKLLADHADWYKSDCEFSWAFCRYFWESHVKMNEINIEELEKFIQENIHLLQ
jgi:hypothetical protein